MANIAKTAIFLSLLMFPSIGLAQSNVREATENAMIYNGVYSTQELKQKMTNGDGVRSGSQLQQDFAAHGISVSTIQKTTAFNGYVTKGGRVIVGEKTVATNAKSYGRTYLEGSTKEGALYSRPTSVSFNQSKLPAFVFMENGQFKFAIIKSCGNLTTATPVVAKKVTTPTVVSVVQTQTQIQTQPLPQTGMESAAALGLTGITGAGWYYRKSKIALSKAQKKL